MSDIVILGGARTAIDTFGGTGHMVVTAENMARDQIVPVEVKMKRDLVGFDTDEHPKPTTLEGLGKLRPAFEKDGTVTAGNASGLNDDAAALVLARREVAEAAGLKPKFRIVGYAHRGQPRAWAGRGESEPEWRRHCAWPPCRRDRRHSGGEEHV